MYRLNNWLPQYYILKRHLLCQKSEMASELINSFKTLSDPIDKSSSLIINLQLRKLRNPSFQLFRSQTLESALTSFPPSLPPSHIQSISVYCRLQIYMYISTTSHQSLCDHLFSQLIIAMQQMFPAGKTPTLVPTLQSSLQSEGSC